MRLWCVFDFVHKRYLIKVILDIYVFIFTFIIFYFTLGTFYQCYDCS